jgi:kynurenine 3-monooxygenase
MSDDTPVTIVGSGLAGTLLACMLGKSGRRVDLYEKRPDPRIHGQEAGRSINLALSVRGLHALREVGLAEEVVKSSILMRGRMIHSRDGSLAFQPYGKDDREALNSVSRAGLNLTLVNAAAQHPNVHMHFAQRCAGFDVKTGDIEFVDSVSNATKTVGSDFVIGADGAYSAVRAQMQKLDRFDFSQEYLTHGYKELTIPPAANGGFGMEKHALHIWPRGSFMMIALPNLDGSFTCTLFWPLEGPNSFAALRTESEVLAYFRDQFPDAVPLIPTLARDFLANPTGSLVTIRCRPWSVSDRVVLVGDACHAVVPFLGQGMNAAFEDCTVLGQCLEGHGRDRRQALEEYERLRKEHVDALADMCIDNFIEMRDKVGSWVFRLRKRLAIILNTLLPRWYLPLYTMIEFTRIPYADARRRARRQDWIVRCAAGLIALLIVLMAWRLLR